MTTVDNITIIKILKDREDELKALTKSTLKAIESKQGFVKQVVKEIHSLQELNFTREKELGTIGRRLRKLEEEK